MGFPSFASCEHVSVSAYVNLKLPITSWVFLALVVALFVLLSVLVAHMLLRARAPDETMLLSRMTRGSGARKCKLC
jgi:hypothetical protein